MAAQDTIPAGDEESRPAAAFARPEATLRERLGRASFRRQVRDGVETKLKLLAKKKGAEIRASEVPHLVGDIPDAVIDEQTDAAMATDPGGNPRGPIMDWFKSHPELVNAVVAAILKLILGA